MSGPAGFIEDWQSKHGDPLASGSHDFPFEELFAVLDGDASKLSERDRSELCSALREILRWIVGEIEDGSINPALVVGYRALALAWVVDPGLIPNAPSLRKLAHKLKRDPMVLSRPAAAARRKFGLKNRASVHAWNFRAGPPEKGDTTASTDDT